MYIYIYIYIDIYTERERERERERDVFVIQSLVLFKWCLVFCSEGGEAMRLETLHRAQIFQFELFELKFINSSCSSLSS